MSQSQLLEERECVDRCRSTEHGELVGAALTKRAVLDSELCSYLHQLCCSCESVKDVMGRTALHVAASCGRLDVVKWLIRTKHANINAKDCESGYTPLHRSIFYGKINVAVYLIKSGANMNLTDLNGLTSLEHAVEDCDRLKNIDSPLINGEVYVWGSNTNYTLGPQQARLMPELLDAHHRENPYLTVKQICLEKYHCILVSAEGKVFACGHGQGGRLGLGTEKTIIVPEQVKFAASGLPNRVTCEQASIAIDHSVFLTDSGHVWTCGLNTHRVLGIQHPVPTQLLVPCPLPLMQHSIRNVCAAKYHTVAWGVTAIYTWGLHGGQLGHDKTTREYVIAPKLVTCLFGQNFTIVAVSASNGATAVVTSKGDIYVLHEYQCRKIASRQLNITSISVVGGKLNDKIDNSLSTDENHELVVIGRSHLGNLYLWRESDPQFSRCIFSINRFLNIRQVTLNLNEILFITYHGEAYQAILKQRKRKTNESNTHGSKSDFHKFLEKDNCQLLKVTKIPRVYRALSIHSDLKGKNYAVLQANPAAYIKKKPEMGKSRMYKQIHLLLQEASEDDPLHDVVFKVSGRCFPAHRFIVAVGSSQLLSLMNASADKVIELTQINPDIFEQLLLFLYTHKCDLGRVGKLPEKFRNFQGCCKENVQRENADDVDKSNMSAFQCYKEENRRNKLHSSNKTIKDPVRMLQEAAKRFGVDALQQLMNHMYCSNGYIKVKKQVDLHFSQKYIREEFPQMHDVVLKCKDGKEISVHKCILAARLEYFNNLFSRRWNENSSTTEISLPHSYNVLDHLIEFLYTDDIALLHKEDMDHVCNLLIVADQLLVWKLKEICECSISTLLTLKNVVQMLSFSTMYNAKQLKTYCMEFICTNLSVVLELKLLEVIDEELLGDLTDFYCNYNSAMQHRIITPYSNAPCDEVVSAAASCHQISFEDSDCEDDVKTTLKSQKKRSRTRKHTLSENYNKEQNNCSYGEVQVNAVSTSPLLETKTDSIDESRCKSNEVQIRLRAIAAAQASLNCDNVSTEYTRLPLKPNNVEVSLADFPELDSPHSVGSYSKSPNKIEKLDLKHKITKLSQKQRKRLSSESSGGINAEVPCSSVLSESPKNPWKICTEISNISPVGSPNTSATMDSIITAEKKQKENFVKMKTKLLLHTQIEDKAIEDLYKFYNVDNVFDELVFINRVPVGSVASPVWIHSNKLKRLS